MTPESTETSPSSSTTTPQTGTQGPTWPRWVLRITSLAAAIMLFDQAIFAGQFLSGVYPMLHVHRENATYAGISVLLTAAAAVLYRWPGHGPWWPIAAYAGLFGLIALQITLGFSQTLAIHIPLGVTIILTGVVLAVLLWVRR